MAQPGKDANDSHAASPADRNNAPASPVCYAGQGDPNYHWGPGPAGGIRLKRIYDPAEPEDGTRVLVDRIWPRGIRKDAAQIDRWLREAAPSPELRKWFAHKPERWTTFAQKYKDALESNPEVLAPLLEDAAKGPLTLLFAAKDRTHNHAVVLRQVLLQRLDQESHR